MEGSALVQSEILVKWVNGSIGTRRDNSQRGGRAHAGDYFTTTGTFL